jgi:serine protease Do
VQSLRAAALATARRGLRALPGWVDGTALSEEVQTAINRMPVLNRRLKSPSAHRFELFQGGARQLRLKTLCWLVAAALATEVSQAAERRPVPPQSDQTNGPAQPRAPTPAPARRSELAAAFSKPVPASTADLQSIEQHVKALVARISPAVVAVEIGPGSGSGVVISEDGLVLTAGHVCGRPNRTGVVRFPNGKAAQVRAIGLDRESDTGLMRITDKGVWPHVATGDLEEARAGDWVLALGHPGGFDVERSLVVRLGRIVRLTPVALQTDCPISPGDSGGPLFDMHGRVIGIHEAISSSATENFHVEITKYYDTWDQLLLGAAGSSLLASPRAYVGANGVDDAPGCRITAVEKESPAARAGLKVGDVVVRVDKRDIKVSASFQRWVAEAKPGESLSLEVKRGEQVLTMDVKLETPPHRK